MFDLLKYMKMIQYLNVVKKIYISNTIETGLK